MRHDTPPVLSVRQPYADFLVHGDKLVEVRTWPTAYRGTILIHASQRRDPDYDDPDGARRVTSAILGSVNLRDIHQVYSQLPKAQRKVHVPSHDPRFYYWIVDAAQLFTDPIPCAGRLGLWSVPVPLRRRVMAALRS